MRRSAAVAAAAVAALVTAGLATGPGRAAGPSAPPAAAAPTTTGLVLHYGFDADTGTRATDSAPYAVHGSYVGTTAAEARSTGLPGQGAAVRLVGAQHQYVAVPERDVLDVNRFTVAALVRRTGVENDATLGRWEVLEKAGAYWVNIRTTGRVRVGGFFGGCANANWVYLDSTVVVPVDTWTHVAGTYNGSTLTVWVNGVRSGSRAVSGTTCRNDRPLAVGAKDYPVGQPEAFWDGQLDEVRVYRRALTGAEVRGLLPG